MFLEIGCNPRQIYANIGPLQIYSDHSLPVGNPKIWVIFFGSQESRKMPGCFQVYPDRLNEQKYHDPIMEVLL